MAKVLYFSVPQYGQVHPSLPLVRELVQRGEQVLYYLVTDRFKELIEANGATLRLYKRPPVQTGLTFIASFVNHLRQMIVQLLEEVRAGKNWKKARISCLQFLKAERAFRRGSNPFCCTSSSQVSRPAAFFSPFPRMEGWRPKDFRCKRYVSSTAGGDFMSIMPIGFYTIATTFH